MKYITAKEAVKLAEDANNFKCLKHETEVFKHIKSYANMGFINTYVNVPVSIYGRVESLLTSKGYKVFSKMVEEHNAVKLEIEWA